MPGLRPRVCRSGATATRLSRLVRNRRRSHGIDQRTKIGRRTGRTLSPGVGDIKAVYGVRGVLGVIERLHCCNGGSLAGKRQRNLRDDEHLGVFLAKNPGDLTDGLRIIPDKGRRRDRGTGEETIIEQ